MSRKARASMQATVVAGLTSFRRSTAMIIPDRVKKVVNSEVKKVAKTGFGKAADHATFAKKHGVSDTMVDIAEQ